MSYGKNDLENIIALCDQDETGNLVAIRLSESCKRALAYQNVTLHLTKADREYLQSQYDEKMDPDAKETLHRILKH